MAENNPDKPDGLRIGDNIEVRIGEAYRYYRIKNKDGIYYTYTGSSVAASTTAATYTELTDLDPPTFQIYQVYAVMPDANIRTYIKQPASTNRWGTNRAPTGGYITDRDSPYSSSMYHNFWVIEDYPPNIGFTNATNIAITPIVKFYGWRYEIEPLSGKPGVFTPVTVMGIGN